MSIGISAALGAEVEQLRHDADRYQQVIADLTSELSRLHVDCHNLQQRVNGFYGGAPLSRIETVELRQENERLRAEIVEARRDAERYRWLTLTSDTNPLMICDVQSGRLLFGYEADAEIDIHRYGGGA